MQLKDTALDEIKWLIINYEDKNAKALIESSGLHHTTDNHGRTLLHFAAERNRPSMARYLLDEGCNPNPIDATGCSPLMLALKAGSNDEVLTLLLDAGADIDREDRTGRSPLRMALNGDGYITDSKLQLVLENLRKECGGSSEETAKRLMDEACRLDQAALLKDAQALHVAVTLDDADTVKLLLEKRPDLHRARDFYGTVPLNYVYDRNKEHNNEKIVILKSFMKAGASPTDCELLLGTFQVGATLLNGSAKAIRVLMQSGMDCTARDKDTGKSVLHYLARNVNDGVAEVLAGYVDEFDVNVADRDGRRPLNGAASAGSTGMMKFLLEHGAEVEWAEEGGYCTPLFQVYCDWDRRFGKRYGKCVNLLLQHGADPQFVVEGNRTLPTIFSMVAGGRRVRPVVARLALMERLGRTITDATRSEINSEPPLRQHWERCQRMLDQRFTDEVTVYDLLTCDRRKMSRYVKLIESLGDAKEMKYEELLKNDCSYYYGSIKRRFQENSKYVKSQATVHEVLCKLLQNRVDSSNIIIERIEDYLDDRSLENLYKLGKNGDLSK